MNSKITSLPEEHIEAYYRDMSHDELLAESERFKKILDDREKEDNLREKEDKIIYLLINEKTARDKSHF